jgi:hypothetical protein
MRTSARGRLLRNGRAQLRFGLDHLLAILASLLFVYPLVWLASASVKPAWHYLPRAAAADPAGPHLRGVPAHLHRHAVPDLPAEQPALRNRRDAADDPGRRGAGVRQFRAGLRLVVERWLRVGRWLWWVGWVKWASIRDSP